MLKASLKYGNILLWALVIVFTFTVPISEFFSTRILVLTSVLAILIGRTKDVGLRFIMLSWDALFYVLVLAVGLLHSNNLARGWSVIETSLSLFAVPLVISRIEPFRKEHLHKLFFAFTTGLIVTSSICFVNAVFLFAQTGIAEVFFFESLTKIMDFHPTYFAYCLVAAITFGLYLLYYERTHYPSWPIVLIVSFLFLMLMLTGGTAALVSTLFVLAFFVLKFMLDDKPDRRTLVFFFVASLIACMFVFNESIRRDNPTLRNDSWERLALWESALNANYNVFFGVGTGDSQDVLNAYYISHGMPGFASVNYNPHNQFIDTFFSNGLVGLLSLILLLGRPIYRAVRNGSTLATLIFFPFIIYGITEVFFGRYQGVVFFALMQQLFGAYFLSHKRTFSLKRS